jgi:hypothetical protein
MVKWVIVIVFSLKNFVNEAVNWLPEVIIQILVILFHGNINRLNKKE